SNMRGQERSFAFLMVTLLLVVSHSNPVIGATVAFKAPVSYPVGTNPAGVIGTHWRSEEHTSELQSLAYLVCRLLLEKKNPNTYTLLNLKGNLFHFVHEPHHHYTYRVHISDRTAALDSRALQRHILRRSSSTCFAFDL